MAVVTSVHLVQVTTDDRKHQLWAAATERQNAINLVLNAIPEGWTAALLDGELQAFEAKILNLAPGTVRQITSRTDQPDGSFETRQ